MIAEMNAQKKTRRAFQLVKPRRGHLITHRACTRYLAVQKEARCRVSSSSLHSPMKRSTERSASSNTNLL